MEDRRRVPPVWSCCWLPRENVIPINVHLPSGPVTAALIRSLSKHKGIHGVFDVSHFYEICGRNPVAAHGVVFYVAVVGPTFPRPQIFCPQIPRAMIRSYGATISVKLRSPETSRDLCHGLSFCGG